MRVRVLYFGVFKDGFGSSGETLKLPEEAQVADLLAVCRERFAGPDGLWESIAVAVNQEYARRGDALKDGDEVALLPPVSGGVEGLWHEG
jgi:molybdopterin converting factor subunit 1